MRCDDDMILKFQCSCIPKHLRLPPNHPTNPPGVALVVVAFCPPLKDPTNPPVAALASGVIAVGMLRTTGDAFVASTDEHAVHTEPRKNEVCHVKVEDGTVCRDEEEDTRKLLA
mmetsp:Transcript_4603/g.10217  ORF Transcript_4603/g.10217 Transcript_4603/m.10217 type:complete len:114 (-) Transcript_4603:2700-3041(-)